jgi:hypothetical protein
MKRFIFLCLFVITVIAVSAQDYTLNKPGVTQINDATLSSAATSSKTILLKIPDGHYYNYQFQWSYTELSGTSEVWVDTYCSNDGSNWEAIARAAGDTLKSGNAVCLHEDNDGFAYRYLKVLLTAKTATQSTHVHGFIYLTPFYH